MVHRSYLRWFHIAADAAGVTLPPHRATHMLRHHRVRVLRDLGWREEEIADWIGDTEQTLTRVYGKRERTSMSDRADELAAGRERRPGGCAPSTSDALLACGYAPPASALCPRGVPTGGVFAGDRCPGT